MLRRIVDIVAVTAACAVVSGVSWYAWSEYQHHHNVKQLSGELRRFDRVLAFQSASGQAQSTSRGWPKTVDPSWFGAEPPRNPLVSHNRPWLEIAPREHAMLRHPPIPVALDLSLAAFWYNPYQGIIRARVPMQISDSRTLQLYNAVNSTSLASLYDDHAPPTEGDAALLETASAVEDSDH